MSLEKLREFEEQAEKVAGMALDLCQERSKALPRTIGDRLPLGFKALCALALAVEHTVRAFVLLARSLFRP